MEKIVVLNSGGFDSTVLLAFFHKEYKAEIHSLYFSYGQTNDSIAAECARLNAEKYCKTHKVIALPKIDWTNSEFYSKDYESLESKYLEARNLIFASYAVSYAESIGANSISMALIKDGEGLFNDCSKKFVKKLDRLCREFGVIFIAPFIDTWKESLYQIGTKYNIHPNNFISCDVPINGKPCGTCPDCKAIEDYKSVFSSKKT